MAAGHEIIPFPVTEGPPARTGVLLLNVGTPQEPTPQAVRRYLRQFLSDPRVLDMHPVGRWLLLNAIILPFRPKRSAEAYRRVWDGPAGPGSPLMVHSQALAGALAERLPNHRVELAMRYGEPSIGRQMERLQADGCERVVAVPLFPQYASSTTGTALERVYREAAHRWNTPHITVVPPFFDHPRFIGAVAATARPALDALGPDHILMSFHGLPERHVHRSDATGAHCLRRDDCCASVGTANRACYRAQCFATARAVATELGLSPTDYTVAFQSRLGRLPWIGPHTDKQILELARGGARRLAVMCPSFVTDCLETLEEIGLAGAEQFREAGGEVLELVPCVNARPEWVEGLVELVRRASPD